MNRLLFEGRSLVEIVASVIRQDDGHVPFSRLDWERMYRLADYHRVANTVYLGLLGHRETVPDRWRDRFFQRYQESLLFGENCQEALKEVLTWLDMREISCTVLVSESIRELYKLPETADNSPVQIFLDEDKYFLAKGYLIDLGYETDKTYKGFGERMRKVRGVTIILYHRLPFRTSKYEKYMVRILESAQIREPYENIWMLPVESELTYRMAGVAYRYVTDELTLREMLELFLFHRQWRDEIEEDALQKRLEEFKIDGLAYKLLEIAYMWFGEKSDPYLLKRNEDISVYDPLEERILTRGILNKENDEQAIRLQKLIEKEIAREKKEENRSLRNERIGKFWTAQKRKLKWAFPDYHYMSSIYPAVEKIPILLPVYWIIRGLRLWWRSFIR